MMKLFYVTAILSAMSLAQNATPQSAVDQTSQSRVTFSPGTELRAQLDKTVDAKKAKAGDPVQAKTLDELKSGTQVLAPRGARITGHVVAANPHEKDSPSHVEIAFDKIDLGNGSEVPLNATIQALAGPVNNVAAAADNNTGAPTSDNVGTGMGGRGTMQSGSMGQPAGAPDTGSMGNNGTAASTSTPSVAIAANAQGVQGISGVSLSPGPSRDSLLTSEKHNVKLESGTQMILRTQ